MAINWGGAAQNNNPLAYFAMGQQIGQDIRQRQTQNALATAVNNPQDKGALEQVTKLDPQMGMALRQKLSDEQAKGLARNMELMGQAAQWADTPEKWDQAIDYLAQSGVQGVEQYKGKFSPQLRMSAIASSGELKTYLERTAPVNVGPGSHLVDPVTGQAKFSAPFAPRPVTVNEGQTVVEYAPGNKPQGGFDGFYNGFLAGAEGGYNPKDPMSGAPVNFGIDQRANPDINVKDLTQDQAKQLMLERYWKPSGADQIQDPALQAIHADTAINMGVGASKQLLQASGGDPEKYLQLREKRYREIGGPVLDGWLRRNDNLRQYTGLGQGRVIAQGAPKSEKPKWRTLSPDEAQKMGLPAGTYQQSPEGEIKPIGGIGDKAPQSKEAYSQSAMDAFDRAINTADGLLKHPGFNTGVGMPSINPFDGNLAGFIVPGSPAADFRTSLETMKAQVFLPMVQSMKGMGALSNAEGEKLTAAIGNLNPSQSEGQFKSSVEQIIKDLKTYRNRATQGAPASPTKGGWGKAKVVQ